MRMDEMNAYFESKGFEVRRSYNQSRSRDNCGYYDFIISKNNNHTHGVYCWSSDQKKFMDALIRSHVEQFEKAPVYGMGDLIKYADERGLSISISQSIGEGTTIEIGCANGHIERTFGPNELGIVDKIKYMIDSVLCTNKDIEVTKMMYKSLANSLYGSGCYTGSKLSIKKVIFNDPATIVLWADGSKTVVKCQVDDIYDPEKGLAMAISKKALGNKGNYCNEIKKWLPKEETPDYITYTDADLAKLKVPDLSGLKKAGESLKDLSKSLRRMKRNNPVQKAYDILVKSRDGDIDYSTLMLPIEEAISYLGEALED